MRNSSPAPDGLIVVDKPAGWTSHDVVAKMRGIAGTRSVGHLGTLDPIATGVLPVMIGQATRLARFMDKSEKAYDAVVRFGFATTTYDREGETTGPVTQVELSEVSLNAALDKLRGPILQTPPPVSAKKINGVPAYKLARKNQPVELAAVPVTIHDLVLKEIRGDRARLFVRCSAGTYIRSLAHELGIALGCGAHIEELVRTAAGPFTSEQARTPEELDRMKNQGRLAEAVLPMAAMVPAFPSVLVDESTVQQIRHGRDFAVSPFRSQPGSEHVKALDGEGRLVAIGRIVLPHLYHPEIVFAV